MTNEKVQLYVRKPRVFILSSISADLSDAQSLSRYLLYANQFETEGLVACTSVRNRNKVHPQKLEAIVDAYAGVVQNLNKHVHPNWQYPAADNLKSQIKKGAEVYGMRAVHSDVPISPGAQLLYERIKAPATQPLWILCWGGANTLAQALLKLDASFPAQDLKRLLSRIRVYAISDQDDSGTWIRRKYPEIFYIASIHAWNQYGMAAWTGISGEKYYSFDHGGPNSEVIEKDWIQKHIQSGPLGSVYPDHLVIAENATPTFLYLIQNGLGIPEHPDFGSWGGRYARTNPSADGVASNHFSDIVDRVLVSDRMYTSNQATIWRWREAVQNDFAARIKWSIEPDFSKANHHPVITINDVKGLTPVRIEVGSSSTVALDTNGTYDPAGRALTFKWWHYREPTATQWDADAEVPVLDIKTMDDEGRRVEVNILPPKKQSSTFTSEEGTGTEQRLHLILEVTNNGTPPLTTYRRVLMLVSRMRLLVGKAEVDEIQERVKNL